jgi:PAS domain S-box-containing protein
MTAPSSPRSDAGHSANGTLSAEASAQQTDVEADAPWSVLALRSLEELWEHAGEGIALLDVEGHVRYLSPSARRLLGLGPGAHVCAHAHDLLDGEALAHVATLRHELQGWRRWLGPTRSSRGARAHDLKIAQSDGSVLWLEVRLSNRLRDPRWKSVVVNFRDITRGRQKRAEMEQQKWELEETQREIAIARQAIEDAREAMRQREAQLHGLFDNVLAAVLVTGDSATPTLLQEHPEAVDWLGLGPNRLVNLSAQDFLAPEVRHLVPSLHDFRALFESGDTDPESVEVQEKTLFFSDLKNSTAFYEAAGDEPAYGLVRSHFDYLSAAVERNGGVLVKTIGDAVMAAFDGPGGALRAALEMQHGLRAFNTGVGKIAGAEGEVVLKIGLHHGPAIAVKSGDKVDYFGRTVNIAARLSGACTGRDIVTSAAVWEHPDAPLARKGIPHQISPPFQGNLKGIQGVFTLYRATIKDAS